MLLLYWFYEMFWLALMETVKEQIEQVLLGRTGMALHWQMNGLGHHLTRAVFVDNIVPIRLVNGVSYTQNTLVSCLGRNYRVVVKRSLI